MSFNEDKPSLGSQIRTGLKGIHGAGEVIRGAAMKAADDVFETKEGNVKNQAIVDKGLADVKNADSMVGEHHGVKHDGQHVVNTAGGAHATAPGNVGMGYEQPVHHHHQQQQQQQGYAGGLGAGQGNVADVNVPQEHMGTNQRF